METYTKLDGTVLDLSRLSDAERAYLARAAAAYRAGEDWVAFCRLVEGPENPLLAATGGRITTAVWEHPLWQAVRDLENRLGVQQRFVALDPGDDPTVDPFDDTWLTTTEAAARKGVSLPGLHYAIRRGELLTRPAGHGARRLVSRNSLARWQPVAVRQRAGRARGRAGQAGKRAQPAAAAR